MHTVLIIAGSDAGGGAGIQADTWAVRDLGGYAATAITAITAQNTRGVRRVDPLPVDAVLAQVDAVLDDLPVHAVKLGMLGDPALIEALAARLAGLDMPVVVDPVMVATSGDRLLPEAAVAALRERLLPLATVITPNLPEAAVLAAGAPVEAWAAGRGRPTLVTGGDADGDVVRDVLFDGEGRRAWTLPRVPGGPFHGTGCTLASAVATGLARGLDVPAAVDDAIAYVRARIRAAVAPGGGARVGGPVRPAWTPLPG